MAGGAREYATNRLQLRSLRLPTWAAVIFWLFLASLNASACRGRPDHPRPTRPSAAQSESGGGIRRDPSKRRALLWKPVHSGTELRVGASSASVAFGSVVVRIPLSSTLISLVLGNISEFAGTYVSETRPEKASKFWA